MYLGGDGKRPANRYSLASLTFASTIHLKQWSGDFKEIWLLYLAAKSPSNDQGF